MSPGRRPQPGAIPFVAPLEDPRYAEAVQVSPGIRRVVAENPSKYTYRGTGTYIVGHGDVAVVDPGPLLDSHRDALADALRGERVRAILVTHCHADHSPLTRWLREEAGAPTYGFGPHPRPEVAPETKDEVDDPDTREAVDYDFRPDHRLVTGDAVAGPGWELRALHTPGHTSNHLCFEFAAEQALFTGDHVMGWSTTVVAPPDGDMRAYVASLRTVMDRRDAVLWPTHGNPVTDPGPYLQAYLDHRLLREAQVLAEVRAGTCTPTTIVEHLYRDVPAELHRAAAASVLAHLLKLVEEGPVEMEGPGPPTVESSFRP